MYELITLFFVVLHFKFNFSLKVDINKDGIEDRFIVYDSGDDLFLTIKIVLSDKGREKLFFNSKMLSNNITSGEGFRNISFENRFFTIEENTSTDPVQIKYTTFSIDYKTNEIFLYKVEVSNIFNNASDDFDIIRTQKDFGKVSFENYDPETLNLF